MNRIIPVLFLLATMPLGNPDLLAAEKFDTNPKHKLSRPDDKSPDINYNRNAETYMEVGLGLGWAMADLLKKRP